MLVAAAMAAQLCPWVTDPVGRHRRSGSSLLPSCSSCSTGACTSDGPDSGPRPARSHWSGCLGTFLTAAGGAAVLHAAFGMPWYLALLVATAVSPTDPAVVFSVLGQREIAGRSGTILEGESGANDPVGIALMGGLIAAGTLSWAAVGYVSMEFLLQMVLGASRWDCRRTRAACVHAKGRRCRARACTRSGRLACALLLYGLATAGPRIGIPGRFRGRHSDRPPAGPVSTRDRAIPLGAGGSGRDRRVRRARPDDRPRRAGSDRRMDPGTGVVVLLAGRGQAGLRATVPDPGQAAAERAHLRPLRRIEGRGPDPARRTACGLLTSRERSVSTASSSSWSSSRSWSKAAWFPSSLRRLRLPVRTVKPEPWALGVRLQRGARGRARIHGRGRIAIDGATVDEAAELAGDIWISIVVRHSQLVPVRADTRLKAEDIVVILADANLPSGVADLFTTPARADPDEGADGLRE